MSVDINILSAVLGRGNVIPPVAERERRVFFAIKRHILSLYGEKQEKIVVQRIRRECFGCDGSGRWKSWDGPSETCLRCGGSGLYSEIFVHHEQWRLGPRTFLNPIARKCAHLGDVDIEGTVRWGGNPRHCDLCRQTLLWLFAPAEFWRQNNPLLVGFKAQMKRIERIARAIGTVPVAQHLYLPIPTDVGQEIPF